MDTSSILGILILLALLTLAGMAIGVAMLVLAGIRREHPIPTETW